MSDKKIKWLEYSMRETAILYAAENGDAPVQMVFTRADDGLDIPPSTCVRVTVELLHNTDEVTPVLEMSEIIGV